MQHHDTPYSVGLCCPRGGTRVQQSGTITKPIGSVPSMLNAVSCVMQLVIFTKGFIDKCDVDSGERCSGWYRKAIFCSAESVYTECLESSAVWKRDSFKRNKSLECNCAGSQNWWFSYHKDTTSCYTEYPKVAADKEDCSIAGK